MGKRLAIAIVAALVASPADSREPKKTKEERRLEQLRAKLGSKDPNVYCEAVLTLRPADGFYPYCSAISYPSVRHSFTARAGIAAQTSILAEWRLEGDRRIPNRATALEKQLIDDAHIEIASGVGTGCLGRAPASCIGFLASRFLVTTASDMPFYDRRETLSFDPEKNRNKMLDLQILLPRTDMKSDVKGSGYSEKSPAFDVVGLGMYVVDGRILSLQLSGRYPILSDNPDDYRGTGFAAFVGTLFPKCKENEEDEFYRKFWAALVKPQQFSKDSGKWRFTQSGVTKSYLSYARGELCDMRVESSTSTSSGFTDEGRRIGGSTRQVTFRLPPT